MIPIAHVMTPIESVFLLVNAALAFVSLMDLGLLLHLKPTCKLMLKLAYTVIPIGALTSMFSVITGVVHIDEIGQVVTAIGFLIFSVKLYKKSCMCLREKSSDNKACIS